MPITAQSFPNFYLGTAAELHVASLLYIKGYECLRLSPDVGIDYLVTNRARIKFHSEIEKSIELQVKCTTGHNGKAALTIDADELEYLALDTNRYLAIVIYYDFDIYVDPCSADTHSDLADLAVNRDIASYEATIFNEQGLSLRFNDPAIIFDYEPKSMITFWLNSAQLTKGIEGGLWTLDSKNKYKIQMELVNGVEIGGFPLLPELLHLPYIMEGCSEQYKLDQGAFTWEHI